jgi:hypothetical protein
MKETYEYCLEKGRQCEEQAAQNTDSHLKQFMKSSLANGGQSQSKSSSDE